MRESDERRPGRVQLRAGDLVAELVGSDLFGVRWRGTEVLQRLYYAVRDAPWNTIPGRLVASTVEHRDDRFVVHLEQHHRLGDIDLTLSAIIEGDAAGTLTYRADTDAATDFGYSKIGLNLHHGLDTYRGARYRASTIDGAAEGTLEEPIVPQLIQDGTLTAMFAHFDAITFDLGDVEAELTFEGDRFEMQDHRNWCDANWKTYGTPLEYGFPMAATAGQRWSQTVRLRCSGGIAGERSGTAPGVVAVALGSGTDTALRAGRLPQLGVALDGAADPRRAAAAAAPLGLAFVRYVLDVDRPPGDAVAALGVVAEAAGAPLELVVPVDPDRAAEQAREIVDAIVDAALPVARLVVVAAASGFSEFRGAAPPELATPFVGRLAERGAGQVAVHSGSGQSYNVICRDRPPYADGVGLAFAVVPQIHASDDVSVLQNAAAVGEVVLDCRRLYPGRPVAVTPVHLAALEGPYPSGPPSSPDDRPQDDVRHTDPFGAAWAVAAISAWSAVGTDSVTLFDAVGARGVIATTGEWHPVAAVLAALGGRAGSTVAAASIGDPGAVAVLDVGTDGDRVVLVANVRDEAISATVSGLAATPDVRLIDDLDRTGAAEPVPVRRLGDDVVLDLRPWAVAVLQPPATT